MSAATQAVPTTPSLTSEVTHWTCHRNEDVAWCGLDVSALPWDEEVRAVCVVCDDIEDQPDFCPLGLPCICSDAP